MVCELIKRGEGGTTMSQGASWYRKLPQLIRLIQLQQLEKRNLEKQRQKNVNKITHTLSLQSHDIIIIFFNRLWFIWPFTPNLQKYALQGKKIINVFLSDS